MQEWQYNDCKIFLLQNLLIVLYSTCYAMQFIWLGADYWTSEEIYKSNDCIHLCLVWRYWRGWVERSTCLFHCPPLLQRNRPEKAQRTSSIYIRSLYLLTHYFRILTFFCYFDTCGLRPAKCLTFLQTFNSLGVSVVDEPFQVQNVRKFRVASWSYWMTYKNSNFLNWPWAIKEFYLFFSHTFVRVVSNSSKKSKSD